MEGHGNFVTRLALKRRFKDQDSTDASGQERHPQRMEKNKTTP